MVDAVDNILNAIAPELERRPGLMQDKHGTFLDVLNPTLGHILVLVVWGEIYLAGDVVPTYFGPFCSSLSLCVVGKKQVRGSYLSNVILIRRVRVQPLFQAEDRCELGGQIIE